MDSAHTESMAARPADIGKIVSSRVNEIVEVQIRERGGIIRILEETQAAIGWLPKEALQIVAEKTGRSLVDIYGVATFYRFFSLKPRGEHLISCCLGTACHVRGGALIAEEFVRQLGVKPGENTPDGKFTLQTVACLGACALGPIVVGDGRYFSNVNSTKVKTIIQQTREGLMQGEASTEGSLFPLMLSCPHCNHSLMDAEVQLDHHPSVRVTLSFEGKHGALRLSSLYGSYTVLSEFNIPRDAVVDFFCPHCHGELKAPLECTTCGAPMVPLLVKGGGIVQICARRGCRAHMLDLSGTNL